jgi:hypothetical protein
MSSQIKRHASAFVVAALVASACGAELAHSESPDHDTNLDGLSRDADADVPADSGERRAPADAGHEDVDAGVEDAGEPDAGPTFLSFVVPGPEGTDTELTASVPETGRGDIVIEAYPEDVTLPLRHGTLSVAYEGAFSAAFCNDVRNIAKLAERSEALRQRADSTLRRTGSLTAQLPLSPFVGPTFEAGVVEAARDAGAEQSSFRLDNPLVLSGARILLVLDDDAISHYLGGTPLQQRLDASLAARRTQALASGTLTFALAGKDLWCDLTEGRARLEVSVEGESGDQDYRGTTTVQGVEGP